MVRLANVSMYAGLVVGVGAFGAYFATAADRSWWVATVVLLVPLGAAAALARRVARRL